MTIPPDAAEVDGSSCFMSVGCSRPLAVDGSACGAARINGPSREGECSRLLTVKWGCDAAVNLPSRCKDGGDVLGLGRLRLLQDLPRLYLQQAGPHRCDLRCAAPLASGAKLPAVKSEGSGGCSKQRLSCSSRGLRLANQITKKIIHLQGKNERTKLRRMIMDGFACLKIFLLGMT